MITEAECELIASAVLRKFQQAQQDQDGQNDVLPDGSAMRSVLKSPSNFSDAKARLMASGLREDKAIPAVARIRPDLYNEFRSAGN